MSQYRLGIDLASTRLRAAVLDTDGQICAERQVNTLPDNYHDLVAVMADMVTASESEIGAKRLPVGVATPTGVDPRSGRMRSSDWLLLSQSPLSHDLSAAVDREIRVARHAIVWPCRKVSMEQGRTRPACLRSRWAAASAAAG